MIPLPQPDQPFTEVTHQGKQIKIGDEVIVHNAGERHTVTVSSITKRSNHYWVGYANNQHFCPWPLVQIAK